MRKKDLLKLAKKLKGKTFKEIGDASPLDNQNRRYTKGVIAKIIETEYFGIAPNTSKDPDFKDLEVELKVSPFKSRDGRNFTLKERSVLSMVDYNEIAENKNWEDCSFSKKLKKVLYVLYFHDYEKPAEEWKIMHSFLWEPNHEQMQEISRDYEIIRRSVLDGRVLSERHTNFLGTCPKHPGGFGIQVRQLAEKLSIDFEKRDNLGEVIIPKIVKSRKNVKPIVPTFGPKGQKYISFLANHPVLPKAVSEKRGWCIKMAGFQKIICNSLGKDYQRYLSFKDF